MWNIYFLIVDLIVNDKGVLDEHLQSISIPLANFVSKSSENFMEMQVQGQSVIQLFLLIIQKIFKSGLEKEDEFESMVAMTLTFALLENLKNVEVLVETLLG